MPSPITVLPKSGSPKRPPSPATPQAKKAQWAAIIEAASRNPLALFALCVLAVEAMFGVALLPHQKPEDRLPIIYAMLAVLALVIIAVTAITMYRIHTNRSGLAYGQAPLPEMEKKNLIDINKASVVGAEAPPLNNDTLARELQQLRLVLHQAQRYSTPTYYLDTHLSIIHWNVAFELIFQPILANIRRRHVNYFIAELANHDEVFDHARDFTEKVKDGQLPLVDIEHLVYSSASYGMVEFEKVATQLTDPDAHLKAWSVALFLKQIDWDMYRSDLFRRLRNDKLWSLYAVSYDIVLSEFTPYQNLLQEVLKGIPSGARRVLEIGAGTGNVTRLLLQRDYSVTALENNPTMLEKMSEKKLASTGRLTIIVDSVENVDLSEERAFDAVVAVNVVYALEDPYACFRKVAQSLKRTGMFVFSTTYSETSLNPLLAAIERELRDHGTFKQKEEHYRRLVDINNDIEYTIAKRYSREDYVGWLEQAGFEITYNAPSYKDALIVIHARKI
jgi:SAM-dependent methyltransferase